MNKGHRGLTVCRGHPDGATVFLASMRHDAGAPMSKEPGGSAQIGSHSLGQMVA